MAAAFVPLHSQPQPPVTSYYFVDPAAQGSPDGYSWQTAWLTIGDALLNAPTGAGVLVKSGTYVPPPTGFLITRQISFYGGCAGTELSPDQRVAGGPTVFDGGGTAKHVVFIQNVSGTPGVLIDRIEIRGGNANGTTGADDIGGGILCLGTNLDLTDCRIHANSAVNTAHAQGGGLWMNTGVSETGPRVLHLKRCEIFDNSSGPGGSVAGNSGTGGGIWANGIEGIAAGCTFATNTTSREGGAVYFEGFENNHFFKFQVCQFWANTATDTSSSLGGAIGLELAGITGSFIKVDACTFADNTCADTSCPDGQAIYCGSNSTALISNSILFFNHKGSCPNAKPIGGAGTYSCSWCDVEGQATGSTNISLDPVFTGHTVGRLRLKASSPCIDCGNGTLLPFDELDLDDDLLFSEVVPLDVQGLRRVVDVPPTGPAGLGVSPEVDMGAFEVQ